MYSLLVVVLLIMILGGLPGFGLHNFGYGVSGGGLVLLIVVLLLMKGGL